MARSRASHTTLTCWHYSRRSAHSRDSFSAVHRLAGSGDALVTGRKSADLRGRDESPGGWRLHFTCMGAIAVECLMRARCIVVGEVPAQQASEMPFAEDDDVIEAFASNRPDDALGEGILPGCSWGDEESRWGHFSKSLICMSTSSPHRS